MREKPGLGEEKHIRVYQEPKGAGRIGVCLGKEVPFNDMKLIHVILCKYLHIIITVDTTKWYLITLNI